MGGVNIARDFTEWLLDADQTKGAKGRLVYANSKLRKELTKQLGWS